MKQQKRIMLDRGSVKKNVLLSKISQLCQELKFSWQRPNCAAQLQHTHPKFPGFPHVTVSVWTVEMSYLSPSCLLCLSCGPSSDCIDCVVVLFLCWFFSINGMANIILQLFFIPLPHTNLSLCFFYFYFHFNFLSCGS